MTSPPEERMSELRDFSDADLGEFGARLMETGAGWGFHPYDPVARRLMTEKKGSWRPIMEESWSMGSPVTRCRPMTGEARAP